jgi:hypothetical protein
MKEQIRCQTKDPREDPCEDPCLLDYCLSPSKEASIERSIRCLCYELFGTLGSGTFTSFHERFLGRSYGVKSRILE